jgi:Rod binding domain-containing protein
MLKEMRKSVPRGEGIFALSTGEEIFGEFMDQELARQVAGAGVVGIARIVESQQVLDPGRHTTPPAKENPRKTDIIYKTGLPHKRPGGIR